MRARQLWKINPHCHWCGVKTELVEFCTHSKFRVGRGKFATVDHIKSRCEAASLEEYSSRANQVLACHACNQRRNNEFQKTNPERKSRIHGPSTARQILDAKMRKSTEALIRWAEGGRKT